jgi:hypothetical protein
MIRSSLNLSCEKLHDQVLSQRRDTRRYEANVVGGALVKVLLQTLPDLYSDGMYVRPPLYMHDKLTSENFPLSCQVMIICMYDLKMPTSGGRSWWVTLVRMLLKLGRPNSVYPQGHL